MGRHGGAPSLEALIKETRSGEYAAALHVGDFAYDLASDGGEVSTDVYILYNLKSSLMFVNMTKPQ
jgi:hypothetical protein